MQGTLRCNSVEDVSIVIEAHCTNLNCTTFNKTRKLTGDKGRPICHVNYVTSQIQVKNSL